MKVTKAAWPHMLKQKYGRIINTSSSSGLYGSGGQANYSSAKLALVGLSATLAKEGQKNNVLTNVIAPIAGSRMTETILPADLVAALDPKYVAPVVAYLCHESSTVNGAVFESGAGYCAQVRWQRSAGVHFPISNGAFTPEAIASKWEAVNDFSKGATYPQGLNDTMGVIVGALGTGQTTTLGQGRPSNKQQVKAQAANGSTEWKSDAVFAELAAGVEAGGQSICDKLNGIFVYNISSKDGKAKKTWTASLKKGTKGTVYEGAPKDGAKADVTIDVSDDDYVSLAAGKASAQMLFMKGKLKMKGNMTKAMLFDSTIKAARAQLASQQQPIKAKL